MANMLLASGGDDIKLWDTSDFSLVKQFNPHGGNVSSLSWTQDNTCLGSASTIGDKIAITHPDNPAYSFEIAKEEEKSCLAFNSMSRYAMGGGADALIHVWDLKSRMLKMTYKDHKAKVTSIQFNWNDTMIASGSESGEIILFSVLTGMGYSPLVIPKGQAVRQVQYSHFKKSLLASVSDDGTVNLWDTSSKHLIHSYVSSHKAPSMGLAFSPLNEMLMMSVGLDKRIVCYDVLGKCAVKTISAESPLTCIDLMPDGATIAVGTTRGKVFIYDLRQGATPVKILSAHKSSVQCLKFQHGAKSTATIDVGSRRKSSTTNTSTQNYRRTAELDINSVNNNLSTNSINAVRSMPHLDNHSKDSSRHPPPTNYSSLQNISIDGHQSPHIGGGSHKRKPFTPKWSGIDDMFSPLNDNAERRSRQSGLESAGPSPMTHSRPVFSKEEEKLYGLDDMASTFGDMDLQTKRPLGSEPPSMVSSMTTSSSREFDLDEQPVKDDLVTSHATSRIQPTNQPTTSFQPTSSVTASKSFSQAEDILSSRATLNEQFACLPKSVGGATVEQSACLPKSAIPEGAVGGATGPALQPFHTQFIRNIVEDALDDFRDEIRQDILNLHTEVLKQFLIQQADIEGMIRRYSINEELLAEVERLKEENRRLKKKF